MEVSRQVRRRSAPSAPGGSVPPARTRPGNGWRRALAVVAGAALLIGGCVGTATEMAGGGGGGRGGGTPTPILTAGPTDESTSSAVPVESATPPGSAHAAPRPDVVPPGLVGRAWAGLLPNGRDVVGLAGSRTRLVLGAGERALGLSGASVATVTRGPGDVGSIVRIRPIAGGRPELEVARAEEVLSVAFAGDRLLAAGHDPSRSDLDTGVVSLSLTDGSATVLIGQTALEAPPVGDLVRTVRVSASGRTAVSGLCSMTGCAADIIDLGTGRVHRVMDMGPNFPGALTDDALVVGPDYPTEMSALDVTTGRVLWTKAGAEFQQRYLTSGGSLVASYIDHQGSYAFTISVIDPVTGNERVILSRDVAEDLTLWPELSGDEQAVVGTGGPFSVAAAAGTTLTGATLDLSTGEFVPDVVEIDPAP